jgi:hypothetical protein
VGNSPLVLWPSAPTVGLTSTPDTSVSPKRRVCHAPVLRYVLVNDANLKTQAHCAQCGTTIGQRYVQTIASRNVFCDFACYGRTVQKPA